MSRTCGAAAGSARDGGGALSLRGGNIDNDLDDNFAVNGDSDGADKFNGDLAVNVLAFTADDSDGTFTVNVNGDGDDNDDTFIVNFIDNNGGAFTVN
ncbi:MAG: hypothetical protein MPK03_00240, partial [Alphaproteobacteria bacterium]|nr:hypothetical protein [Alphaproteobacteria bacterium]MDA8009862.1 hypothetical protein [Alphaproteobacteria bacterium]